ncbi:GNAT family N-acetyltransferase [Couchioplanes caeruleus]|uniref:GNAT family N-acetyltransferase n=2 Tax=Couchioplanes caeruleus TaxID=56438 RepID=A0A1K0FCN5_9ACTN|nr:GNAT family N-acetyltransferase [Couchioplanes caeruleus]OJF10512.1 GNAT family N-acetyltransferase [Couchioplanes caeruleus subsp. caeruleus]ROP28597.1 acetyltransferase (GNAT) family protein [Couchioplanes caeruleus]
MKIAVEGGLGRDEASELYESVGWFGYTRDPDKLVRSLAGSHVLLTVRQEDGRLVGLARTISDGETVCYVQDLLVRPEAQRRGIGRVLMEELKRRYIECRFFLLSTDHAKTEDARKSHPFYRSLGLIPHEEQGMAAFGLPVKR